MSELRPSSSPAALRVLLGPAAVVLLSALIFACDRQGLIIPNPGLLFLALVLGLALTQTATLAILNIALGLVASLLFYGSTGRITLTREGFIRVAVSFLAFAAGAAIVLYQRCRLEKALAAPVEAERNFFHAVLAAMHDAIVETDWQGIRDVNPSFCAMTGFTRHELLGAKAPFPFWPPEQVAAIAASLETAMRGRALDFECVLLRKNGERFPALMSVSRILDAAPASNRILYTFRDITTLQRPPTP